MPTIAAALADLLSYMDADAEPHPGKLARLARDAGLTIHEDAKTRVDVLAEIGPQLAAARAAAAAGEEAPPAETPAETPPETPIEATESAGDVESPSDASEAVDEEEPPAEETDGPDLERARERMEAMDNDEEIDHAATALIEEMSEGMEEMPEELQSMAVNLSVRVFRAALVKMEALAAEKAPETDEPAPPAPAAAVDRSGGRPTFRPRGEGGPVRIPRKAAGKLQKGLAPVTKVEDMGPRGSRGLVVRTHGDSTLRPNRVPRAAVLTPENTQPKKRSHNRAQSDGPRNVEKKPAVPLSSEEQASVKVSGRATVSKRPPVKEGKKKTVTPEAPQGTTVGEVAPSSTTTDTLQAVADAGKSTISGIAAMREEIEALPENHPRRAMLLGNLASIESAVGNVETMLRR